MNEQKRVYESVLQDHLESNRQMVFLSGPRQVGKTTLAKTFAGNRYFSWDDRAVQRAVVESQKAFGAMAGLDEVRDDRPIIALDEIHKYTRWKSFLKGFFDHYEKSVRILVTGSARLDVYRRGGDSMMGRYFLYRMHPFSVGELLRTGLPLEEINVPSRLEEDRWSALWTFGGFPEPFCNQTMRFLNRWRGRRSEQLIREDLRDLTRVFEVDTVAVLTDLLRHRAGEQLVVSSLARDLHVAETTVSAWIKTLEYLYFGFTIRPWFRNVENSLRKTPKWYQRDWCEVADDGKRFENLIACHLLKAVEMWTDLGLGEFGLYYLRDKQKREVDFLVSKNGDPWFLVEAKLAKTALSSSLEYFQKATGAKHAFQVTRDMEYVEADCFQRTDPVLAPARTFLGQLP